MRPLVPKPFGFFFALPKPAQLVLKLPKNFSTQPRKVMLTYPARIYRLCLIVRRHVITHTGERPYKCPSNSCSRRFSRGSSLKKHMTSIHQIADSDRKSSIFISEFLQFLIAMILAATTRSRKERHRRNGIKRDGPEL